MKDENTAGASSYMDHVADAASLEAYSRHEEDPLLSAETLPANSNLIDFKTFAEDYPEKLFPLLFRLRPEFQELFAEYWILGKSQHFIAKCHGFIQTRTWQNLRIIEQALGSLILLGPDPSARVILPILEKAGLEDTPYGSLTQMIVLYAASRSYASVADQFEMPVPAVRKTFRPVIAKLLASKDVQAVAVGAYLKNLTHQASLTKAGLSKRCLARIKRVGTQYFDAPPVDRATLLSHGRVERLGTMPWAMLEISSDDRIGQIREVLPKQMKKLFGKKHAAQVYTPLNEDGTLRFGYIFARATNPKMVRALLRIRGISDLAAQYNSVGDFKNAVTVPDTEVQEMLVQEPERHFSRIRVGDFVRVMSGDAGGYCGNVIAIRASGPVVQVDFPTGRKFLVTATPASLELLNVPVTKRTFWGAQP